MGQDLDLRNLIIHNFVGGAFVKMLSLKREPTFKKSFYNEALVTSP